MAFTPHLNPLPTPQRALWLELGATPGAFTLYGGTALVLRLGHRTSIDYLRALDGVAGPSEFREALDNAPAGVIDARSWAYWNLKCGRAPAPPLPVRGFSREP
jgi:hypothetical protein